MTNQEILTKAIEKAIEGGWDSNNDDGWLTYNADNWGSAKESWRLFIFNHGFAKALWGTEMVSTFPWAEDGSFKYETQSEAWIHHLQQMVISDDPIKYLGENL